MQVVHFTRARCTLYMRGSIGRAFRPAHTRSGDCHLGCLLLGAGECVLLTVTGSITFIADCGLRLDARSGTGVVLNANEYFALEGGAGGIMMLIRCPHLKAHDNGISTPQRIMGQQWPGDGRLHRTPES